MRRTSYAFSPELYERELRAIVSEVRASPRLDAAGYQEILRRYPKDGSGFFSKSEVIRGYRHLRRDAAWTEDDERFLERLRMKPVRTQSGVAPVTVLTKPFPCPGKCIFCPSDVRMPKSYLSDEPGAQRAAEHQFDPYAQTASRLRSFFNTGHRIDKIELIILGGTWSFYAEEYQRWFVLRCFEAMNDFVAEEGEPVRAAVPVDYRDLDEVVAGDSLQRTYNAVIRDFAREREAPSESATWDDLERAHRVNETADARCVGLVLETRPDHISLSEVLRLRRLGATKVQIGYQSLSDEVLAANRRGHDVAATRRAMTLLRSMGFKIHAHWMPNLYGSSAELDAADYRRLWSDSDFRPDELKIYPCSLIETAELMAYYNDGRWQPYGHEELTDLLVDCISETPPYCRLTRVIRDIPGTDIVVGNKVTNLRQVAENALAERGLRSQEIRAREVRARSVAAGALRLDVVRYEASEGEELFLQFVGDDDELAGFLRLRLPGSSSAPCDELDGQALLREVHVYGAVVGLGKAHRGRAQHQGLGRQLVEAAAAEAAAAGYAGLAVISAIGTRDYYRSLGFADGALYQHLDLGAWSEAEDRN
ncbi:MAG: tRNA uridine(34) 5-carboxymethylaminomethyl modification radical SAM/GNAT enzyme Elp3 [Acidobacteriota bacterium]